MASVLDSVKHYQHSIEKYPNDEQKVLKCIDKLYNLAVTVQHLQETGVGRTVNALRKEPGDVGQAARALVYKWKTMVAAEESDQDEQKNDTTNYNGLENGKYYENDLNESRSKHDKPEKSHKIPKTEEKQYKNINGNHGSKRKYQSSEEDECETKRKKYLNTEDNGYKIKSETKIKQESSESEIDSQDDSSQSDSESDSQSSEEERKHDIKNKEVVSKSGNQYATKKHTSSATSQDKYKHDSGSENKKSISEKHHRSSTSESKHSSDKPSKEKSHSSHTQKSTKISESSHEKKEKEHKSLESDKRNKTESSSSKHSERHRSNHSSEKQKSNSSSDKNRSSSNPGKQKSSVENHRSSSHSDKHRSSSSIEKQKSLSGEKSKHHSEKNNASKPDKEKHKHVSEKEVTNDKHKIKENISGSDKDRQSSSSKERSKEKNSSSKVKEHSQRLEKNHSSSKDLNSSLKCSDEKKKSDSSQSEKSSKKSKHRSSSSKAGSSKSKDDEPKKKDKSRDSDDGIDCGSGASFAEALGMISPAKPKKKSAYMKDSSSPNSNDDMSPAAMLAPMAKLAPLPALEISALPEISPNYRPRPPPKFLPHFTDEDAMNAGISSKNQRTKVYSGNKVIGKITTLYEMCVHILQEHIDSLEYTGGVPYDILKPVVDRATPQQLFVLEHYNPYLMDDTDHLWQKFCEKNFRNKKRQEMETWREMYMRCQEEQEIKLKSLTANIRIAQEAKKAPIKQTKMAYVDSVVKPPRNIAKKQAQHGTAFAATASPAARVASLAAAPNVLKGGRPAPVPSVSTSSSFKPKKAPLMQKALQFLRGRKR